MKSYFPPVEIFMEFEPEETAQYLLLHLNMLIEADTMHRNKFNRYNITNGDNPNIKEYAGSSSGHVAQKLNQSWIWLLTHYFIAPLPDEHDINWVIVTDKGQAIKTKEDFERFSYIKLLPKELLDTKLAQKVWPIFIRGDFDISVFAAFKEVEVRMRTAADLSTTIYGVDLARGAFNPEKGNLTDIQNPNISEREAYAHLFAGAIGAFKNPSSHRDVNYDDPKVATSLILFANTLIQIIDKRAIEYERRKKEDLKIQASR